MDMTEGVTAERLIKRYDKLKAERSAWESVWEEIATYVVPSKAGFVSKPSKGDTSTTELYDSTAVHSSNLLAASIHSALTSPAMVWFSLRFRNEETNKVAAAKEWLEDCAERMDAAINESSFNSEVNELYQDMVDFGTASQLVEMQDGKLHIKTNHLGSVVFAEDKNGIVDTVFREFEFTARQILQKWDKVDAPKVRKAMQTNPDKCFHVIHVSMPREGKDVVEGSIVAPKLRPIAEYYIIKEDREMVEEGGSYEFPYLTPRWSKRSGDSHGYSPTMIAMPDIKTLNRAKKLELTAWEKSIDPPMKANELDVISDVDLRPGGLTMMRDINGISPMVSATNWTASMMKADELRQSIRNIYFTDQLVLPDVPNATAYEMSKRYETMQRLLGSTFGRLVVEYLDPFVERVFNLMMRAGQFKAMPEEMQDEDGNSIDTEIDIDYVSPLARSQRMEEVQAIQGYIGFVASNMEIYPEGRDMVDFDDSYRVVAERMGVPARAIPGEDDIKKTRAKRQQEQKAMMEAAAAAQGGGGGQPIAQ